jgi:hypothetical protein
MMFQIQTNEEAKNMVLNIYLPQGKTMKEINNEAKEELHTITTKFHGYNVYVTGRCTTALAMLLGHELAHVCKSVSIFDPKENQYVTVIKH